MLRISEEKAEAAKAALHLAGHVLDLPPAPDTLRSARSSIRLAYDLLKEGLEPSRANRGKPRKAHSKKRAMTPPGGAGASVRSS